FAGGATGQLAQGTGNCRPQFRQADHLLEQDFRACPFGCLSRREHQPRKDRGYRHRDCGRVVRLPDEARNARSRLAMTAAGFGVSLAVAAAIIEAFAQVVLKQGASVSARRSFWIAVAVALFAVELLFYTSALQFLEVSTAFPISGLSFAVV